MKNVKIYLLALLCLCFSGVLAQTQIETQTQVEVEPILPLVTVGNELGGGWNPSGDVFEFRLTEPKKVRFWLYSAGIDLAGQEGDERYQDEPLLASFYLKHGDEVLSFGDFEEGPSTWIAFYEGLLAAGTYQLESSVTGKGKNVFAPVLEVEGARQPLQSYLPTINVSETAWLEGASFELTNEATLGTCELSIYDGDGPEELAMRLVYPNGEYLNLDVPSNREWADYANLDQLGRYRIELRQPENAYQATNAIRIRVSCNEQNIPLDVQSELELDHPIEVRVIDTLGNTLAIPYSIYKSDARQVYLAEDAAYRLIEKQIEGGSDSGLREASFGVEGGKVTFILELIEYPILVTPTVSVAAAILLPLPEPKLELNLVTIPVPKIVLTLEPSLVLERSFSQVAALACQVVTVTFNVTNTGPVATTYNLNESLPAGALLVEGNLAFQGNLAAGESATHSYKFEMTPSFNNSSFRAVLSSDAPEQISEAGFRYLQTSATLTRIAPEGPLYAQDEAVLRFTISNPLAYDVTLSLESAFSRMQLLEGESTLFVPALSTVNTDFNVQVGDAGVTAMQIIPFACEALSREKHASQDPVIYQEDILPIPQLPAARQTSTITIDMVAYKLPVIEGLILVQELPESLSYLTGTSFVDGEAVADPDVAGQALIYTLENKNIATVQFDVLHEEPFNLNTESSSLVVLSPNPEVILGNESALELVEAATALRTAAPAVKERVGAVILSPLPNSLIRSGNRTAVSVDGPLGETLELMVNGERIEAGQIGTKTYDEGLGRQSFDYVGIELKVGPNSVLLTSTNAEGRVLRDRLTLYVAGVPSLVTLTPLTELLADSASPLVFEVKVQDAWRNTPEDGFVTFEIEGAQPAGKDATEQQSGFQVLIKDGLGQLSLEPLVAPDIITITSIMSKELGSQQFEVKSSLRDWIVVGYGSAAAGYSDELSFGVEASFFARGNVFGSYLLTLAGNYPNSPLGLFDSTNYLSPYNDFPIIGSQGTYAQDAFSQQGIYARLERDQSFLQYGDFSTALEGQYLGIARSYTGLNTNWSLGDFNLLGYAARANVSDRVTDLYLKADGTRVYTLPNKNIKTDSLQLSVLKANCENPQDFITQDDDPLVRSLNAGFDYFLDETGILRLSSRLPLQDDKGNCYYLLANYQLEDGAASEYDWQFGAQALYDLEGFKFRAGAYQENTVATATTTVISAGASAQLENIKSELDIAYGQNQDSAGLAASAQVAYTQGKLNTELRYDLTTDSYRSTTITTASPSQNLNGSINYQLSPELALSSTAQLSLNTETQFSVNGLLSYLSNLDLGFAKNPNVQFGLQYARSSAADDAFSVLLGSAVQDILGVSGSELSINHRQGVVGLADSSTEFSIAYPILENLRLRLTDRLVWGNSNSFLFGLETGFSNNSLLSQLCRVSFCEMNDPDTNLGFTNATAQYELSNGVGQDAGRLLLNVDTQYPLNEKLSFTAGASQSISFTETTSNETAFSLGSSYNSETLQASAVYDLRFAVNTKHAFFASSTFALSNKLFGNVSLDYLNESGTDPSQGFKFSVAGAYRGNNLSILSNQNLRFGRYAENLDFSFTGDSRLNWQISEGFSVRASYLNTLEPELGYRDLISLGSSFNTWQGSSIAAYGRLFHDWQQNNFGFGASLELSQQLGCGVNAVAGYNFFDNISQNAGAHFGESGAFIRLDFIFDEQWRCGAASLSGQVLVDGSQALSGVRVDLVNQQGDVIKTSISDEKGNYSFNRVTPGNYTLVVHKPYNYDFAPQDLSESYKLDFISLDANGEIDLSLTLAEQHDFYNILLIAEE